MRELTLEETLVAALSLARRDATVARTLPVVFAKNESQLDLRRLEFLARRQRVLPVLGFFLDMSPLYGVPSDYKWNPVVLDVSPPVQESEIHAFGYRNVTISCDPEGIHWTYDSTISVGGVLEVYPAWRDSAMLPFPSFSTSAPWVDQMSGGPIFNESGFMCGLITSSQLVATRRTSLFLRGIYLAEPRSGD